MSIRITKKQVEEAAAAREKALKDDSEFRDFEEQQMKEMQAATENKNRKEKS